MKAGRRLILKTVTELAIILLLHAALLHWLAKRQVVAAILSAGDHVPPVWIGLAVAFVIVRFFALVLLPGFALLRLVRLAFYFLVERRYLAPENAVQRADVVQPAPTKS